MESVFIQPPPARRKGSHQTNLHGPLWRLKERQSYDRTEHRLIAASKIRKILLLDPDGESKRMLDGDLAGAVCHATAPRLDIRDEETALHVVIRVKSLTAREGERAIHAPTIVGLIGEFGRGTHHLRRREQVVLHAPGADVFAQSAHRQLVA